MWRMTLICKDILQLMFDNLYSVLYMTSNTCVSLKMAAICSLKHITRAVESTVKLAGNKLLFVGEVSRENVQY